MANNLSGTSRTRSPRHVNTHPAQAHNRGMSRRSVRGWAVWGASLAIVLLLDGIVWTLVIAW